MLVATEVSVRQMMDVLQIAYRYFTAAELHPHVDLSHKVPLNYTATVLML